MTAELVALTLVVGLVVPAVAGPRVLRRAAPWLMRMPRSAVGLLAGGVVAWVLAALALGPILAWVVSGPPFLPGTAAAEVCRQCLAAADPFGIDRIETAVPAAVLLALPAAGAGLLALSMIVETRRRRRGTARTAQRIRGRSEPRILLGHDVQLVDDAQPFAFSLPRRHGGIVVSTGAVALFSRDELAAVLAHERAHLTQRHHLITTLAAALTTGLRWIPLLAAAESALAHYVEIAADDAARRQAGTTALASALLLLAEADRPHHDDARIVGALHALGPDRIRHLVQPGVGATGRPAAIASMCCLAALVILATVATVPYASAAVSGCI